MPPPRSLSLTLVIRHRADPYLAAQRLTHNTLWFGLARRSVMLLAFLLLLVASLAMLGRMGKPCLQAWRWAREKSAQWDATQRVTEQWRAGTGRKARKGKKGKHQKSSQARYVNVSAGRSTRVARAAGG